MWNLLTGSGGVFVSKFYTQVSICMNIHRTWSEVAQVEVPTSGMVEASDLHTDFVIHARPSDVSNCAREDNDLVLNMRGGGVVRIKGFFTHGPDFNHLVFADGGQTLFADFSSALTPAGDGVTEPLRTYAEHDATQVGLLPILGGWRSARWRWRAPTVRRNRVAIPHRRPSPA
jgi:hypothetical protein